MLASVSPTGRRAPVSTPSNTNFVTLFVKVSSGSITMGSDGTRSRVFIEVRSVVRPMLRTLGDVRGPCITFRTSMFVMVRVVLINSVSSKCGSWHLTNIQQRLCLVR